MTTNRSADLNVTGNSAASSSTGSATRVVDVGDSGALRRRGRRPLCSVGTPLGPCEAGSGRSVAVAVAAVGRNPSCTVVVVGVAVVPLASATVIRVQNTISIVTAIIGPVVMHAFARTENRASEIIRDTANDARRPLEIKSALQQHALKNEKLHVLKPRARNSYGDYGLLLNFCRRTIVFFLFRVQAVLFKYR